MFTGIISDVGTVQSVRKLADTRARIACHFDPDGIPMGASIACNGVCLTVVDKGQDDDGPWFDVDYSAETLSKTNLGDWVPGARINLERSLKVGDEMGGHVVSGHVDGLASIAEITEDGGSTRIMITVPEALARYIAPKGSVALNGTSLTVNSVQGTHFDINLIPHTKTVTNWGSVAVGDKINLEIDMLARYVARLADFQAGPTS